MTREGIAGRQRQLLKKIAAPGTSANHAQSTLCPSHPVPNENIDLQFGVCRQRGLAEIRQGELFARAPLYKEIVLQPPRANVDSPSCFLQVRMDTGVNHLAIHQWFNT